ncbi:MAG: inorganic diphosphatase [Actinomycetota bacterium]|nr:inorganic diphosphatase [Actinomycetota bacterium]
MSEERAQDASRVEVVVEIPKGSRNKYEVDHSTGEVWLDRPLYTATRYPADYGFLAHTLGEDGDPLDALVLGYEPVLPGVHVWARPVAAFLMSDEDGPDAKIFCVHADDHRWDHLQDLADLPPHVTEEIRHFFDVYEALEPDKESEVGDWVDSAEAQRLVKEAWARHDEAG